MVKKGDALGDRMKKNYENVTRTFLPRRTYTIIRLDGKAFHTFTKGLNRPWDDDLILLMDGVTDYLCKNIQGAKFGYTQSDEISILLTDFDNLETDSWFGGNIQKIVSVASSMATYAFNTGLINSGEKKFEDKVALFDARTFTIPMKEEVVNYFIWRQQDAIRNSVQMLAQNLYSQKQLNGLNRSLLISKCLEKGHDWEKLKPGYKWGRAIYLEQKHMLGPDSFDEPTVQKTWMYEDRIPKFQDMRSFITNVIPKI